MNLSNEKNTLLNTVSRRAVALSDQPLFRVVTRGAMLGVALTAFVNFSMGSNSALAACTDGTGGDAVAGADNDTVTCGVGAGATADGYDTDGYDGVDIVVTSDGVASGTTGDGIDIDGSDGTTVIILNTEFSGTDAGKVQGNFGNGIDIDGDDNHIFNGGGTTIGGGSITSLQSDGIDINGEGNSVTNVNGGNGGATTPGLISGGGGSGDDGIVISGGTSGNENVVNNGVGGTGTAYIISGGSTANPTGDDGIDASGWTKINNGTQGEIRGDDRGVEFTGGAGVTLTIDNDGTITGDVEDGILVTGDGSIVNYTGDGTVKGGASAAGIDISPTTDNTTINVTFGPGATGLITGGSNGIELGDNSPIESNGNTVNISGPGTVSGDGLSSADGIHVYAGTGNTFNITDGATIEGEDDGIDLGSGNTLLVDASTVTGDTDGVGGGDGIQANDGNNIHVTNGSTVTGDPGMLVDDNNVITIDGGSSVTGNPEDGINADDNNEILIGGAGGAGTVNGDGPNSDGIALTDEFDNSGGGSADDNEVTIGNLGTVDAARDGIVVGQVDTDNERNTVLVEDGGNVIAGRDGIVVNGQDDDAVDNTVTIEQGGQVNAGGDGVRLLGDDQVTTGLGAITGGGGLFGDGDGVGNDLDNDGVIRAGDDGVLVSNTNSDVDNSGGEIYAGHDGVRFTTIHTDAADGTTPFPGEAESGYQSDANSVIVAGRDGIHYDNSADDGADADFNAGLGQDVNGLGEIDDPIDLLLGITGNYPEVVANEGVIEAGRHGISVNDDFDVTNDGTIVAGGLPGEGPTGGDGIHADANNTITNNGTIATGLDADGDSHGIEVDGESNTIVNEGIIDTRGGIGDTVIDEIDNGTLELGAADAQDNGSGGDGIHADNDGLTLGGVGTFNYDQQTIYNGNIIIAADDGIDVQSGLGIGGGEQIIDNDSEGTITADDNGIIAVDFNIITNHLGGVINADDDDAGGGDGINVGSSNVVKNDGAINVGTTGSGIVMDGNSGVFANGNDVTNTGTIDAGVDGIRADGDLNKIANSGNITGGLNGVNLVGIVNEFESTAGTITGGTGAGIWSEDSNFIVIENTTVTTTVGDDGDGVHLGSDNDVKVGLGSTVTGDDDGVEIAGDDNSYKQDGGTITGSDGDGIYISGGNNNVTLTNGTAVSGEDDGLEIDTNDNNTIKITGSVAGEDDGIVLVDASSNTVTITGNVTGDTDGVDGGDGVEINGGDTNIVKVSGAITGDPGVLLIDTDNNNVSGGSISGKQGGVVLQGSSDNIVKTTAGDIVGDSDGDGFGNGVDIDASSDGNTVDSDDDISGADGVVIAGDDNNVNADDNITGTDDGLIISGESNIVTVGNNLTGTDGSGVEVSGDDNNITVDGDINGDDVGVSLSGDDNTVDVGGDIKSTDGNGVDISGDDNQVDVENEISSEDDGVVLSGDDNKVSADAIDAGGNGVLITGDDNDVEIGTSITADLNGVWIQDGSGNTVDLEGVEINAGEDGIQLDNPDNEVEHDENTVINAGDDGVELNYGGSDGSLEVFEWEGTINADDNGIEALGGFMSIINSGTINADVDGHADDEDGAGDGDGIAVASDNLVVNNGTITGWNGITAGDRNEITNEDEITAENDGIQANNENKVINNGTITAGDDGIDVNDDNYVENNGFESIHAADNGIEAGSNNEIVNNGLIEADTDDDNDGDGINAEDGNEITNNGDITGWNGITVDGSNVVANTADATIVAENAGIDAEFNNAITNDGSITATDGNGVELADFNSLTNTGSVLGDNNGVSIVGEDNTVNNDGGSITATDFDAVDVIGEDNVIINTAGSTITGGDDGVEIQGDTNTVTNSGTIAGNGFIGDGVFIFSGTGNIITNNLGGSITGFTDGVEINSGGNFVYNDGTITGTVGDGVDVAGGSNTVNNTNTIDGADDGIAASGDFNDLDNTGSVTGGADGVDIDGNNNNLYNGGGATITGETDNGVEIDGDSNTVDNYGTITGEDDGVNVDGDFNAINNYSLLSIIGETDDGIDIDGDNNDVYNSGSITGADEGIEIDGDNTDITNDGDASSIWGQGGDGIDIDSGDNTDIWNEGSITGLWQGIDNNDGDLFVSNTGGTITGQNSDGIRSNLGDDDNWTTVYNDSENVGNVVTFDQGVITGEDDGIDVGGEGLYVVNGAGSLIQGVDDDGIHTEATTNEIYNDGEIRGAHTGITDGEGGFFEEEQTYIQNTGLITGSEAGYLYEDGSYLGDTVQIDNYGTIEATGTGVLPVVGEDAEDAAVNLDLINGEDADPVAAIDTSAGGPDLDVFIFNWGNINGANEFTAPVVDDPETEEDETDAGGVLLTNKFAILGGAGQENVVNFAGGVINGDIALQGNHDVLALEIGSTLNGDADLGTDAFDGEDVLTVSVDNPETEEDESGVGFASANDVDTSVDTVILFGEGYQDLAGDITEAEILYVNDQLTEDDLYPGNIATAVVAGFPSQPEPVGTWSLNGNVTIDGVNRWTEIKVDGDGDGILDEETTSGDETLLMVDGTVGTVVDNGRLNVGATIPVEFEVAVDDVTQDEEGNITDDTKGDGKQDLDDEGDPIFETQSKFEIQSAAVLTSPVVDVWSGGTLGGHGTIVTNPGANGGNGGVNLTGAVQGDRTIIVGVNEDNLLEQDLESEARGSLILGALTIDDVTQDPDGTITDDESGDGTPDFTVTIGEDDEVITTDILIVQDEAGNRYPDLALPVGFVEETFAGAFDFTTDSPRYATIAPGDEINRVGTLTVVGNVTMDGKETGFTNYKVAVQDDPATKDVNEALDEEGDQIYQDVKGREVVTNWGSQGQFDIRDDGKGDLLNVLKSGVTSAITGAPVDLVGPGPVDLVTQDAEGLVTDDEAGDGVDDFEIVDEVKSTIQVPGEGGPDGIPDSIAYSETTVPDGHVIVDGRLDIRLDGEFVDLVDNAQPALIDDPDGPTGCGDDPDDADSCPQVPNPLYNIPDGLPDVDDEGIAKNNADYSKDAKVWDIIIAQGGVEGKFDEKGFDGGPNDGAVIVRPDDPTTPEDEELRVQLLKAYLQYLPDRVRIISIPAFEPKGTTLNQTLTGEYLDSLTKFGLNEDALHAAVALVGTASDIPAALDALHPEWYNAFNEVGFSIARGAEQQAYIRTIEAQGFSGGQQNRVVMNVGDDSAVGSSASDRRATFWLAGSWGNASIDDGSDEGWLEYKYETLTGYAGFDYLINPNFLLGILGGFSNSDVDAKNASGNEGDVDSWQVGGYVSYFTQSWFINAGGGIGDMNIESIRNIQFGSGIGDVSQVANADYDGDITYFYGKGGYSFDLGGSGWKLSPELALSYAKVKQDGFSETGAGNAPVFLLDVEGQSVESLRGTAQLRLSKTFLAGNGGGWMPYVRVGVANEFEDELRPITSGFQGAPGTSFTVFGQVPRETTVIFGAGVSGKVNEMFSLYLDYSGEIGGSFTEHVISGGVRLHF